MDFIFNEDKIEEIDTINNKIDIELCKRGTRKSNTYVKNWPIDKDTMKTHLKKLKTKLGCNGSVKMDKETNKLVMQLQGDKRDNIKEYLLNLNVSKENIVIHGYE